MNIIICILGLGCVFWNWIWNVSIFKQIRRGFQPASTSLFAVLKMKTRAPHSFAQVFHERETKGEISSRFFFLPRVWFTSQFSHFLLASVWAEKTERPLTSWGSSKVLMYKSRGGQPKIQSVCLAYTVVWSDYKFYMQMICVFLDPHLCIKSKTSAYIRHLL